MTARQVLEAPRPGSIAPADPLVPFRFGAPAGSPGAHDTEGRILTGALTCIARYGVAKTTLDDVAREAGCSRATVYRYVGGKEQLLVRIVRTEAARIGGEVVAAASSAGDDLAEGLVTMAVTAARALLGHEALRFVLEHEPEVVLSFVAFEGGDRFLERCAHALAPTFARWVGDEHATRVAEWCTRVMLAYLTPCGAAPFDLTDADDARRLIHSFVLPGIVGVANPTVGSAVRPSTLHT